MLAGSSCVHAMRAPLYFLKIAFKLTGKERAKMLVAFVLIVEGIVFFVLYNQMPTSLTFFALHNINNHSHNLDS